MTKPQIKHDFARVNRRLKAESNALYQELDSLLTQMVGVSQDEREKLHDIKSGVSKRLDEVEKQIRTPVWLTLFQAAGNGDLRTVKRLIEDEGFHVDTRNFGGYTPLGYAVSSGNMAVVNYLLAQGANPNARTHEGLTPLSIAAMKDNARIFKRLLESGANPRPRAPRGNTVRRLANLNNAHSVLAVIDDKKLMAKIAKAPKPPR